MLADLFPGAILPADPVQRARARLFVAHFESKFAEGAWRAAFLRGEDPSVLLGALEELQTRLPAEGGFVCGRWGIAEMAAAPFLVRAWMMLEHDIGKYPPGEGKKVMDALQGEKYARIRRYVEDIKAYPSFKQSWDEVCAVLPSGTIAAVRG